MKKQSRKVIWFNPKYNKSVTSNIARRFLTLLDIHFPKQQIVHKIFNTNTVKVSCTCTENMSSFISFRNKKVLKVNTKSIKSCNCRNKIKCPLDRQVFNAVCGLQMRCFSINKSRQNLSRNS